jgi:hypothetical protein
MQVGSRKLGSGRYVGEEEGRGGRLGRDLDSKEAGAGLEDEAKGVKVGFRCVLALDRHVVRRNLSNCRGQLDGDSSDEGSHVGVR